MRKVKFTKEHVGSNSHTNDSSRGELAFKAICETEQRACTCDAEELPLDDYDVRKVNIHLLPRSSQHRMLRDVICS